MELAGLETYVHAAALVVLFALGYIAGVQR